MKRQEALGFIDVEIGDTVEINGETGPLYDIRFIQEIRSNQAHFEVRLEDGMWTPASQMKVIQRRTNEQ